MDRGKRGDGGVKGVGWRCDAYDVAVCKYRRYAGWLREEHLFMLPSSSLHGETLLTLPDHNPIPTHPSAQKADTTEKKPSCSYGVSTCLKIRTVRIRHSLLLLSPLPELGFPQILG